jgi:hypothetical protein
MAAIAAIVLTSLGLGFALVGITAIVRGRVPYPSAQSLGTYWIERRKNPVWFWINVVFYLALGAGVLPLGLMGLMAVAAP